MRCKHTRGNCSLWFIRSHCRFLLPVFETNTQKTSHYPCVAVTKLIWVLWDVLRELHDFLFVFSICCVSAIQVHPGNTKIHLKPNRRYCLLRIVQLLSSLKRSLLFLCLFYCVSFFLLQFQSWTCLPVVPVVKDDPDLLCLGQNGDYNQVLKIKSSFKNEELECRTIRANKPFKHLTIFL